jgi:hypothetical protein
MIAALLHPHRRTAATSWVPAPQRKISKGWCAGTEVTEGGTTEGSSTAATTITTFTSNRGTTCKTAMPTKQSNHLPMVQGLQMMSLLSPADRKRIPNRTSAHRKLPPTSRGLYNVPPVDYIATENQAGVKAQYLTMSQTSNNTVTGGRQARRIQLLGPGLGLTTPTSPDRNHKMYVFRQHRSGKDGGLTRLW